MDINNNLIYEKVIPNNIKVNKAKVQITYNPGFSVTECSVGKLPFWGEIIIKYVPDKLLLDFECFDEWSKIELGKKSLIIEEVASKTFNVLQEILKPKYLLVEVTADTTVHYPATIRIESNE